MERNPILADGKQSRGWGLPSGALAARAEAAAAVAAAEAVERGSRRRLQAAARADLTGRVAGVQVEAADGARARPAAQQRHGGRSATHCDGDLPVTFSPIIPAPVRIGEEEAPPSWDPVLTPEEMVGKGLSPKARLVASGSPKLNRLVVMASSKKKASPNLAMPTSKKKKASPKYGGVQRAYWNRLLEKSLVDILLNYKDCRSDNGCFKPHVWNNIVQEFHTTNPHARYTKLQIQEKERELKIDYKMLKEALKQSGCNWNHNRFMIEADHHLWDNLIISNPKIKKFANPKASFPLFDALGELYDGHLAEGNYNITSLGVPEDEDPLQQLRAAHNDVEISEDELHVEEEEEAEAQEDVLEVLESEVQAQKTATDGVTAQRTSQHRGRRAYAATKKDKKEEKDSKKGKLSRLEGVMESYVDLKLKQLEQEAAVLAKENQPAQGPDFSITKCIAVLNKMQVTSAEKVKAYSVFKCPENREIFLSSYEEDKDSALLWLRSEMAA